MNNRNWHINFIKQLFLIVLIFISVICSSFPQTQSEKAPPFTKENIGLFLDSLISSLMKEQNINGCGVTVVNDSSVIFSKGYGYSDFKNKKEFNPDKTLFRTASVCKVVVATALMQLK